MQRREVSRNGGNLVFPIASFSQKRPVAQSSDTKCLVGKRLFITVKVSYVMVPVASPVVLLDIYLKKAIMVPGKRHQMKTSFCDNHCYFYFWLRYLITFHVITFHLTSFYLLVLVQS